MSTYAEFRPTCYDQHIAIDDRENWVIVPVGQNRDSNELDQSNFAAALELLGGESETVEIHRFGHWACGWFEILIVDPADTERIAIVDDIARRLDDYPVLDESDWSNREYDSFIESWQSWGAREFRQECVKAFLTGRIGRVSPRRYRRFGLAGILDEQRAGTVYRRIVGSLHSA